VADGVSLTALDSLIEPQGEKQATDWILNKRLLIVSPDVFDCKF
jgi:hypothetical protein